MEPYTWERTKANKRTLLISPVAFGDALCLTPVLREMKHRAPDRSLIVCCMVPQRQIFFGLPYVDGFVDYPPKLEVVEDFGTVLFLEHALEFNLLARKMHITDRYAQHLGLGSGDWALNKKPDFMMSGEEVDWAKKSFPLPQGRRRLAIQVQAGVRCRSYPISQFTPQMDRMVRDGWEICLVGNPGEFMVQSKPKGIVDMTRMGLTFRQSAAFLTTCDCVLAPDSSMMHVAGTLDIPCVALFGPYPWRLRTAYYTSVFSFHGPGTCPLAPCFHSHHSGLPQFPPNGPCNEQGVCTELASIAPEKLRAKIEQIAVPASERLAAEPPEGTLPVSPA